MDLMKKVDECKYILYIYIAGLLRGEVLKKRPRWLKKGGGRHLEWWR
jgi:hypothetical protein